MSNSSTNKSKIVKYKLELDCINLRQAGLSYQQIADELNRSGKLPEGERIDKWVVMRFLEKIPELSREIVKNDKRRLLEVVNNNLDIVHEINNLFHKTKNLLERMEEQAERGGRLIDPYRYKALVSEMREMLKQMTDIQREINDYNNIRKFMEIVIQVLKEEAPEKIPVIVDRLRLAKETHWFSEMFYKK